MKRLTNKTQLLKLISYRRDLTTNTHFWRSTTLEPSANIRQVSSRSPKDTKENRYWPEVLSRFTWISSFVQSAVFCYFFDFKDLEAVPAVRREKSFPILLVHLILIWKLISLVFGSKTDTKLWKTESHCWNVYQIGALGNVCLQTEARANSGMAWRFECRWENFYNRFNYENWCFHKWSNQVFAVENPI